MTHHTDGDFPPLEPWPWWGCVGSLIFCVLLWCAFLGFLKWVL